MYFKIVPTLGSSLQGGGSSAEHAAFIPAGRQPSSNGKQGPVSTFPGSGGMLTLAAARGAGGRKMLLFGGDDRAEINSTAFPWSAVGYMSGRRNGGCSSAVIGPRHVLTAGHCVWDNDRRQFFDPGGLAFHPNQRGGLAIPPVNISHVTTFYNNAPPPVRCPEGDVFCQTPQHWFVEFAVLTLDQDLGGEYGCLGLKFSCDASGPLRVTSAGFPSALQGRDIHPGPPYRRRMFAITGTLDSFSGCQGGVSDNCVSSTLDTSAGQSGSAIWDGGYAVRAIHAASVGSRPMHRAISKWVYSRIMEVVDGSIH